MTWCLLTATPAWAASRPQSVAAPTAQTAIRQLPATTEVFNSGRGMYSWLRVPSPIPGWSQSDIYWRDQIQWGGNVERRRGRYDFSAFEEGLRQAGARKGRFSFRVMALCPGCGGNLTPGYVPRQQNGAPDWNSEEFLSGYENLMAALGRRYDKDPRLGVVDVGGYGMWGEWYCDSSCGTPLTEANTKRLLRAASRAFPSKYLALGFSEKPAELAADINPRIGLRFDCIGGDFELTLKYLPDKVRDVWKRAPVVGEWCPIAGSSVNRARAHIEGLHLSALSSGNFPTPYAQLAQPAQDTFAATYVRTGFRYSVTRVSVPRSARPGSTVHLKVTMANSGVAPTYDRWVTTVLLSDARRVVGSAEVPLDLRALASGSRSASMTLRLPPNARGTYRIALRVTDPQGYLPPLALANPGRSIHGAYPIGTLRAGR